MSAEKMKGRFFVCFHIVPVFQIRSLNLRQQLTNFTDLSRKVRWAGLPPSRLGRSHKSGRKYYQAYEQYKTYMARVKQW